MVIAKSNIFIFVAYLSLCRSMYLIENRVIAGLLILYLIYKKALTKRPRRLLTSQRKKQEKGYFNAEISIAFFR